MRRLQPRHAKIAALVAGFAFAGVGVLWAYFVTDRLADETRRLSDQKAEAARRAASLSGFASDYFIANQQGDLIFVLAQQSGARQDLAAEIFMGNMLDRAEPVRNMIGELAQAGQLDYRQTYDAYLRLNDAARANLTFATFSQLKQAEREIVSRGQDYAAKMVNRAFELDQAINAAQSGQSLNRVVAVIASLIGSAFLLLANLIAETRKKDAPA